MCVLFPQAARLVRVPWSGNMKDDNAISFAHNLRLVGHDKTLHFSCNNHTNLQAPTTAACILQYNYSRTICSKANAHNPVLNEPLGGLVFNATAHKEAIISVPHQRQPTHPNSSFNSACNLADKKIMQVKTTRVHLELGRASLSHGALSSSYSSSKHLPPKIRRC